MTFSAWLALGIVFLALSVLATTRISAHYVLLGALGLCLACGLVSFDVAARGFVHEGLLTVGALFVVAHALSRTGLVHRAARLLLGSADRPGWMRVRLLLPVAALSAFFNNTPVVALLGPAVEGWSRQKRINRKQLLIPLSYATILGGTCTLLGTSTNVIVAGEAAAHGIESLSLFSMTGVGVCVALAGLTFLLTLGPALLPGSATANVAVSAVSTSTGRIVPVSIALGPSIDSTPPACEADDTRGDQPLLPSAWLALAGFGLMLGLVAGGVVSMLIAAAALCGVFVVTGLLTPRDALRSVDLPLLVAIGASFGLGSALETTGAAAQIAERVLALAGTDPFAALVAVFVVAALLTELVTNNAAAIIVFPIAIATAERLGVSPLPFLIVLMVAASCSFATPIGYQTNLMVYRLGNYRFSDFLRIGVPMNLITGATAVLVTPWFFPF